MYFRKPATMLPTKVRIYKASESKKLFRKSNIGLAIVRRLARCALVLKT